MMVLQTTDDLSRAVADLSGREPRFGRVVARCGLPALRKAPEGLAPLLRIVTEQMISLKAAEAIWARIEAAINFDSPAGLARMPEAKLMRLGLSGAKARCFKAAAAACRDGVCDLAGLAALDNDEALRRLTAIPGIGPWTAEIYLLTSLGRADVWPAGDVALQSAAQDLFELPERPRPNLFRSMADAWRPFRSVAARLLWSHYRAVRNMPDAV